MRSSSLILISTICATISIIMSAEVPKDPLLPKIFFGEKIKDDLTKIIWAHGVNSQEELKKATTNDTILMLEGDVRVGSLSNDQQNIQVPIMSHSNDKSDLSLTEFIKAVKKQVSEKKLKGIKLDFKNLEAFTKSVEELKKEQPLEFPVFLNADILEGPNMVNTDPKPVDAVSFFNTAAKDSSKYYLSVGWTTKVVGDVTKDKYEKDHATAMVELIDEQKVKQVVTYPVRAALVVNTEVAVFDELLKNTTEKTGQEATLTIWSSDSNDKVDTDKLEAVIKAIGKHRVYLDVPDEIRNAMSSATGLLPGLFVVLAMIAANFFYTTL